MIMRLCLISSLSSNSLTKIGVNAFLGMPNLVSLDLSGNSISEIEATAFSMLGELQIIELNNNDLSILPQSVFPSVVSLFVEPPIIPFRHCLNNLQ